MHFQYYSYSNSLIPALGDRPMAIPKSQPQQKQKTNAVKTRTINRNFRQNNDQFRYGKLNSNNFSKRKHFGTIHNA